MAFMVWVQETSDFYKLTDSIILKIISVLLYIQMIYWFIVFLLSAIFIVFYCISRPYRPSIVGRGDES